MHTHHRHPVPAVAAIVIRDGKILLVKRGSEPGLGLWSIPGGSIEPGETTEEALKREVLEETGIEINIGKLAGVYDLIVRHDDIILFHYVLIDYFATFAAGEIRAATDAVDCRWVPLEDLHNYNLTSSLIDRLREHGLLP